MHFVLSPAKTLDYETPLPTDRFTLPDFVDQSAKLIDTLRKISPQALSSLMGISDELALLNVSRYQQWSPLFTPENARPAVFAFRGDVYEGLDVRSLNESGLAYLQSRLRILSALYGLLRPLDLMQPYRLEMGTRLKTPSGTNLYSYWGLSITDTLNELLNQVSTPVLINLASEEYFKSVSPKKLAGRLIQCSFEDLKNGRYKIISFYAKRARGLLMRFAAQKGLTEPEALKDFDLDGYRFAPNASDKDKWVFRRDALPL